MLQNPDATLYLRAAEGRDYRVVEQPRQAETYLIVSHQGIVSVSPNEPTEFQSLAEWQLERATIVAAGHTDFFLIFFACV